MTGFEDAIVLAGCWLGVVYLGFFLWWIGRKEIGWKQCRWRTKCAQDQGRAKPESSNLFINLEARMQKGKIRKHPLGFAIIHPYDVGLNNLIAGAKLDAYWSEKDGFWIVPESNEAESLIARLDRYYGFEVEG